MICDKERGKIYWMHKHLCMCSQIIKLEKEILKNQVENGTSIRKKKLNYKRVIGLYRL